MIELDDDGNVLNAKYAEKRAAQWVRQYFDRTFVVLPPFENLEVELHEPPPKIDPAGQARSILEDFCNLANVRSAVQGAPGGKCSPKKS